MRGQPRIPQAQVSLHKIVNKILEAPSGAGEGDENGKSKKAACCSKR